MFLLLDVLPSQSSQVLNATPGSCSALNAKRLRKEGTALKLLCTSTVNEPPSRHKACSLPLQSSCSSLFPSHQLQHSARRLTQCLFLIMLMIFRYLTEVSFPARALASTTNGLGFRSCEIIRAAEGTKVQEVNLDYSTDGPYLEIPLDSSKPVPLVVHGSQLIFLPLQSITLGNKQQAWTEPAPFTY